MGLVKQLPQMPPFRVCRKRNPKGVGAPNPELCLGFRVGGKDMLLSTNSFPAKLAPLGIASQKQGHHRNPKSKLLKP